MEDTLRQHLIERVKEDDTKKYVGKSIEEKSILEEKPILKGQPIILQKFSSDESGFNYLEGIMDIKKQKIEENLLYYRIKFQSSQDGNEITIAGKKRYTRRDYYCLVQGEEGLFYPNLVEKILRLRNQLMKQEDDYIRMLQGKCSKNEEDVLQEIVLTRRELENAEKVYLISRWRCFHSKSSTYLDHVSSKQSDEDYLLEKMAHFKRKLMKLEGEYVGLIQVGIESLFHKKYPEFSEDVFRRTVRRKRDLSLVEEYISLVGAQRTLSNDESIQFESLQDAVETMLFMDFVAPEIDLLAHDFNIDCIIDLLEKTVHLRKEFLMLEDEYLCLLQERYTNVDVNLIHSNHIWECALEMTVCWRNDRRLHDYIFICQMEIKELNKYKISSIADLTKELWKTEEEYCELMHKRYLTIHKNISSNDVASDIQEKALKDDMLSSRRKLRKLETDLNRMLRRRMGIPSYTNQLDDREFLISKVEEIEDRYFDRLKHNNTSKYFLQHVLSKKTAFEISSNDIGEEREFLTKLYNSIKSYNFYCFECKTCISREIQFSLKFEDDEELLSEVSYEDEEVPKICYQVLQRFLNLRNLHCPNCKTCIKMVTIRHAQKLKTRSTALKQTSTISSPSKGSGELLAKVGTFGSASKDFHVESGTSNSVVVDISLHERETPFQHSNRARKWEIQRSIVLGGLIESITSLVIVTSAASVNLSNGNIVALALTNLIAGLFIVRHNLSGLKKNGYNGVEVEGKQYKEVLIDTMHYLFHFTIAFLSFLFCGLVPLLVYAFSFLKSGNKNLKMIATAGASLSCTAILAIQKAHIEKPQNWHVYVKTVATYVSIGVVAFGLSYLAGYMIAQLTDKVSWDL